jgi:hypothetical protein
VVFKVTHIIIRRETMKQILTLLVALVSIQVALAGDEPKALTEPIPNPYANETAVCLKLESRKADGKGQTFYMRLVNPTDKPLLFSGYSEQSPLYRIQVLVQGKLWMEHQTSRGWCGTGLRECVIPPGQSSLIPVRINDLVYPIKIGVGYKQKAGNSERFVIWSERIEEDAPAPPADVPE